MWDSARKLFAEWGWALLALLALLLAGFGIGLGATLGYNHQWARLSLSFSQAVLAAGMVTGVLRAVQTAGFFKDELRKVIYEDDLRGSLIDSKFAWRNLTQGLFRRRFTTLSKDRLDALTFDRLVGAAEYFYEAHWRQLKIDWADDEKRTIRINETVTATIRTADIGRDIDFSIRYDPEVESSERRSFEFVFDIDGVRTFLGNDHVIAHKDGREELSTQLPPGKSIRLRRTAKKVQTLASDPFLNYASNCLWQNPEIFVQTAAGSGLKFYFRAMGTNHAFVARDLGDIEGRLDTLDAKCEALCLPNQGYMIVVVRDER